MNSISVLGIPPSASGKTDWPWAAEELLSLNVEPPEGGWPQVSIVTPSFNQAQFLEETIRSVLLQGYPNLEYIIMDGGSTDGSVEIIRKYEPWLAHWVSEKDGGQADALNRGFQRASGEYVGWINSDDTFEPGMLFNAAAYLVAHQDVDVVYGNCKIIDENSRPIGLVQAHDFTLLRYLFSDFIPQQTALIRRWVLDACGGIDPGLQCVMDYDLFLRLGLRHTLRRMTGIGGNFRVWQGTKSVSWAGRFMQELVAVLDRVYTDPAMPEEAWVQRDYVYAHAYLAGACRHYGAGLTDAAQEYLARALALHPVWQSDSSQLIDLLTGWADYPVMGDPFRYIFTVFNNLPKTAYWLRTHRSRAIGRGMMGLFFRAHQRQDWALARRAWLLGIKYHPCWLHNRGVLSLGVETFAGARLANIIRVVVRKRRCCMKVKS